MKKEVPYVHNERVHNKRSASIVLPVLFQWYHPQSVLDVGCGLGTWVAVAEDLGVKDIIGVDGDYVNRSMLAIRDEQFIPKDLTREFSLDRKFDLVISLEVAEHLPGSSAEAFVRSLTAHGDVILFSASIPQQGKGQNHINEQWLSYWVSLFKEHNYRMYDVLRSHIWNNPQIEYYYKQNIVVFCKEGHAANDLFAPLSSPYTDIVHPECFSIKTGEAGRAELLEYGEAGVKMAFTALIRSVLRKFRGTAGNGK